MSKRISPKLFRLNINERYLANWFTKNKNEYADNLHEDIKLREVINKIIKVAGIDRIVVSRSSNNTSVDVYCARPGLAIGKGGSTIDMMEKEVEKAVGKKISIMVHEVKQPYLSASIVANSVAEALEKRVPPKIAMKQQIDRIEAAGAQGAKIHISGIGPVKQARTEKAQIVGGKIPLTTLRSKIDYGYVSVLRDKMFGIKVWIYKGEMQ